MPRASLQVAGDPGFAKRAKWDDGLSLRGIEDVEDEGNDMSDRLRVRTGSVLQFSFLSLYWLSCL